MPPVLARIDLPGLRLDGLNELLRLAERSPREMRRRKREHQELVSTLLWARLRSVPPGPFVVTLERFGPMNLDAHDSLPASFKFCADSIAKHLRVDDGSGAIEWRYAQGRSPWPLHTHGARVTIAARDGGAR